MSSTAATKGRVVHWAARYDLLVWLMTLGREWKFRERLLAPARLQPGESVLDVGCGTGTLAIAASRQVGIGGSVHGVDPSAEMIARARAKAKRRHASVTFETGVAEALPFPDATFDVVLSTVMLHHLPGKTRQQGVAEMRRVLSPGGRLVAVDFAPGTRHGLVSLIHGHGHVDASAMERLVAAAGLSVAESGAIGAWGLCYVVGVAR